MLGQRAATWSFVVGTMFCALLSGCSGTDDTNAAPTSTSPDGGTPRPSHQTKSPRPPPSPTPEKIPRVFDPQNFDPQGSDFNRWVPMTPGIQIVRKGTVPIGGGTVPHLTVTTITDVTKKINGVRSLVVLDQDIDAGQVSEQAVD